MSTSKGDSSLELRCLQVLVPPCTRREDFPTLPSSLYFMAKSSNKLSFVEHGMEKSNRGAYKWNDYALDLVA